MYTALQLSFERFTVMSVASWMQEFYPVCNTDQMENMNPLEAAKSSLLKWTGMLPENLSRHNVTAPANALNVIENKGSTAETRSPQLVCALCIIHREWYKPDCDSCPLAITSGKTCFEEDSAFVQANRGKPESILAMVRELQVAVEWEEQRATNASV